MITKNEKYAVRVEKSLTDYDGLCVEDFVDSLKADSLPNSATFHMETADTWGFSKGPGFVFYRTETAEECASRVEKQSVWKQDQEAAHENDVLPGLAGLIDVALRDLELCEADDNYRIDMAFTGHDSLPYGGYVPSSPGVVGIVDLVGAVMAQTLKCHRNECTYFGANPANFPFPSDVKEGLVALKLLQRGRVTTAVANSRRIPMSFSRLDHEQLEAVRDRKIADYHDDRELFFEQMRKLSWDLVAVCA